MAQREIQPITTTYAGVRFRSRLEARWAAFFDLVEWRWEYELLDLEWYIPDFHLRFPRGLVMAEVKPAATASELLTHAPRTSGAGWPGEVLMLGASLFRPTTEVEPSVGLYAQFEESPDDLVIGPFDHALIHRCRHCRRVSFHHATGSWRCAVSGCADGNRLIESIAEDEIRSWWVEAGNRTQWRGSGDNLGVGR